MQLWRHVPGKGLFVLLNVFSSVALIFEGYNQGRSSGHRIYRNSNSVFVRCDGQCLKHGRVHRYGKYRC